MSAASAMNYLCYCFCILAVCRVCSKCLKKYAVNRIVFTAVSLCGGLCFNGFMEWSDIPYISILFGDVLFVCWVTAVFRETMAKKVLTAAVLITVKTLVCNFADSFFTVLYLAAGHMISGGKMISTTFTEGDILGGIAFLTGAAVILGLQNALCEILEQETQVWYSLLSKLLFLLVVIVEVVNWGIANGIVTVSNYHSENYFGIYYDQIFSYTAVCLLTALAMCIAAGLVFGMHRISREQHKAEQYHAQIRYYQMLNEQFSQMERLRHDMKNHVFSLYGLWKGKEWDKMGRYLETMAESGSIDTSDDVTGNRSVDALLYQKRKQAERSGIRFMSDVSIPKECTVNEFDLCVLFGNILDNALNECNRLGAFPDRFVRIAAYGIKKCLLIAAGNSTDRKSEKEIKKGTGYLNMEETVQRYNGTLRIRVEDGRFEIDILLPFSDGCNVRQTDYDGNVSE